MQWNTNYLDLMWYLHASDVVQDCGTSSALASDLLVLQ